MKLVTYIKNPRGVAESVVKRIYNKIVSSDDEKVNEFSDIQEFNEIARHSTKLTDISDHLITLFMESLNVRPRLIVELGVRGGESTFVLERVARLCGSKLISVDIEDCSEISSWKEWTFIRKDDIEFAKEFGKWYRSKKMNPSIDILFVDTSHVYEHTVEEIKHWFPLLSDKAKVFFHDTNLRKVYYRKNGKMDYGWNNDRGVIRALENYFGRSFDERSEFCTISKGWLIKHYPYCGGFTILEKIHDLEGGR